MTRFKKRFKKRKGRLARKVARKVYKKTRRYSKKVLRKKLANTAGQIAYKSGRSRPSHGGRRQRRSHRRRGRR
jgi:hypothetical protein